MTPKVTFTGLLGLALALGCGSDSNGPPVDSTLQNDNFTSGSPAFQGGYATGEAAAVRLGPQSSGFTIRKVVLLFGGDTATKTITLTIYQDSGGTNPGPSIFSGDYSLKGNNSAFQEINLASQNLHVNANQTIRVAVAFQHDGAPGVAVDAALTASRNFIYTGGWITAASVAQAGDFIIRTEITTP